MEKGTDTLRSDLIHVAITGPECTGKSTLSAQLAAHYHTAYIPEYAREYVEKLDRPYTYEDVVRIAEQQVKAEQEYAPIARRLLFYDTYLILTKVWFEVVFKRMPAWIDEALRQKRMDLFLLCAPDIPWYPDNVRENGGIMREKLFLTYRKEIERYGYSYAVIAGAGQERLECAINAVDGLLEKRNHTH